MSGTRFQKEYSENGKAARKANKNYQSSNASITILLSLSKFAIS